MRLDAGPATDGGMLIRLDSGLPEDGGGFLACGLPSACDAPLPPLDPATGDWEGLNGITAGLGSPVHRGRDLYLRESDSQWALAKFAYGISDDDIQGEPVDIYLLRGCGSTWESLGSATTTDDGDHSTVEGVEDTGGRVYFEIPAAARLGIGRHRILFVVRADQSMTSQYIEVLPDTARFVVTDLDGTQTESETAEWGAVFAGVNVDPRPSGAELMSAFADRGYRIFYLSARPEWLTTRSREWLEENDYPPGNVHVTLSFTGALGSAATDFKTEELDAILGRFPASIAVTIGNTDSDTEAYAEVGMVPANSWLYQYDPGTLGTRVDDYGAQIPLVASMPMVCR